MLLGLHTYSFHLHGMGQTWGGGELITDQAWDIFSLMDEAIKLGLDGLHLTAVDLGSLDPEHLKAVNKAAKDRNLFLEYNFSLDASGYDPRLTQTIETGISISEQIGSDIAKISLDLHRTSPVCGSLFHPQILVQLENIAKKVETAAPTAEKAGIKICLENHTEAFSEEVMWLHHRVNHPCVGVCVDTNNSLMVGENPLAAIRNLAPISFTNHFSDHRIEFEQYGCRITGVACGTGDVPVMEAYQLIRANPNMKRLNLEVEFDPAGRSLEEARKLEYQAVVDSIKFARDVLKVRVEESDR
ncbi:MAG: TIM barrel protein [Deltaproteobacteria bacterium]|nr:TIM barrel protein [Deltaproteobacteria bacterium]